MSNHKPEEALHYVVEGINTGNIDSLMNLYEPEACFSPQPGQVVKGQQSIRQNLQGFIDMNGKLESKVKRVLYAGDFALVIGEWSFNGTRYLTGSLLILLQLLRMFYVNSQMVHMAYYHR